MIEAARKRDFLEMNVRCAAYHRRDLKHTFFSYIFSQNLQKHFSNFLTFLWSIAKIGEHLMNTCKICRLLWKSTKIASNFAKWCKSLETSQKSGVVQRKKCRYRQELSNEYLAFSTIYLQNLASIQPRTSLRNGPNNVCSKGPRWWGPTLSRRSSSPPSSQSSGASFGSSPIWGVMVVYPSSSS